MDPDYIIIETDEDIDDDSEDGEDEDDEDTEEEKGSDEEEEYAIMFDNVLQCSIMFNNVR